MAIKKVMIDKQWRENNASLSHIERCLKVSCAVQLGFVMGRISKDSPQSYVVILNSPFNHEPGFSVAWSKGSFFPIYFKCTKNADAFFDICASYIKKNNKKIKHSFEKSDFEPFKYFMV